MRSLSGRTVCVAAAAAAAVAAAVPAASASPVPAPTGAWTATLVPGTRADFIDTTTAQEISCGRSAASGTDNGVVGTVTWGECVGALASTAEVEQAGSMTFHPASSSGGVISGSVSGFNVRFSMETLFGLCTGSITGAIGNVVFDTATNEASVNGGTGLVVSSADNCAGILNTGDPVQYSATYGVEFA
ncbi:hypothetical protein ACFC34_16725 [Streptomyces sp. NPDC056053]|uniref:hypothetical protein n=1 Tax=Streptomyces sp. NPDC056053 TaxID=3345696 RepID=UPI0035DCCCC8